ncbi:MAG: hypothetical protein P3T54_00125 [Dehalogenimonas sp.]|nr:hypothetical protein [Dehalogenimonas sp.]
MTTKIDESSAIAVCVRCGRYVVTHKQPGSSSSTPAICYDCYVKINGNQEAK